MTMTGILAFWQGLMEVAKDAGLTEQLCRKIRPLIRFLFPKIPADHPAYESISMNFIANFLGLGMAATPAGLKAMKDLEKSLKVIEDMYGVALQVLTTGDEESARKIRKKKEKVLDLDIEMRKGHMDRVSKGKCATEMTGPLNDILHAIDRMGNCCVNIADAALDKVDLNYFNATGSPEELTAKE